MNEIIFVVEEAPEEVKGLMAEAIKIHIEGMKEDGLTVPEPTSKGDYIAA